MVLSSPSPNPNPPGPTAHDAAENEGEIHEVEVEAFGTR
jgi:hypothetical protein